MSWSGEIGLSPFGPSDGTRLPIPEMVAVHVPAMQELHEASASRLVVARSGVGKSAFINRLHARLAEDPQRASVGSVQRGHPGLADLAKIAERWAPTISTELWGDIWHAAILRSYASHALCGTKLRLIDDAEGVNFRLSWRSVLRDCAQCRAPVNVFSQIREIVGNLGSEKPFRRYLESAQWDGFIETLCSLLEDTTPAWVLIDIEDDMTAELPGPWASCQRGLLRAITRLRHCPLAGHLIVIATSREQHYSTMMSIENNLKTQDSVLLLDFDETDTATYLQQMLAQIDERERVPESDRGLSRFLDCSTLENLVRRCPEEPADYIVRHTRSQPRDIVVMGNELARRRRRVGDRAPLGHPDVRNTVQSCARVFGQEQLKTCALLLSSGMSNEDVAAEYLLTNSSIPGGYENPTVRVRLDQVIQRIGVDRFGPDTLEATRIQTTGQFAYDVIEALWRSGLLGYTSPDLPPGHAAFYSLHRSTPEIPASDGYAFHPCLIDALMLGVAGAEQLPTTPIADPA